MGSLANSLFQFFLGWIRILLSSLWESVTMPSRGTLLGWIGEHWLVLLIGICVIGVVTDFVVYLFRWRPYRVWASFFRRMRKHREEKKTRSEEDVLPEEAYEASDVSEVSFRKNRDGEGQGDMIDHRPENVPRVWNWDDPEPAAQNPVMQTEATDPQAGSAVREETQTAENDDPGVTARFEQAIRPRRRRARMKDLFSEEGPQAEYTAPQELIDRREAYYRPVYPRNWKGNNDSKS